MGTTHIKMLDMVSDNTWVGCRILIMFSVGGKGLQSVARKYSLHHYTTVHLDCWYKTGWINAFILLMPNSDPKDYDPEES